MRIRKYNPNRTANRAKKPTHISKNVKEAVTSEFKPRIQIDFDGEEYTITVYVTKKRVVEPVVFTEKLKALQYAQNQRAAYANEEIHLTFKYERVNK